MILKNILLIYFIKLAECCYSSKTETSIIYNPTTTYFNTIIPTQTCTPTKIIVGYEGFCADGSANQQSRCKPKYKESTICKSTITETIYPSPTNIPVYIKEILYYKLDCNNRTSSTLINSSSI